MVNKLDYAGVQQELPNNLNRHQTNEYTGVDCYKIGYPNLVCSRVLKPASHINTTSEDIDYNFHLKESSKLGPCCANSLELCNFNESENICNINDKKTFSKNYKICCKGKNLSKSGYKEICNKINKKN